MMYESRSETAIGRQTERKAKRETLNVVIELSSVKHSGLEMSMFPFKVIEEVKEFFPL